MVKWKKGFKRQEKKARCSCQEPKSLLTLILSTIAKSVHGDELMEFSFLKILQIHFVLFIFHFWHGRTNRPRRLLFTGGAFIHHDLFLCGYSQHLCAYVCARTFAMPNAYAINQNKSTLSPRVDCGLQTNIHIFYMRTLKAHEILGENISQTKSRRITVRNKLNQNKMRSLNIYDRFYLFMWFEIVWMCVIDMLNAHTDWISTATQ